MIEGPLSALGAKIPPGAVRALKDRDGGELQEGTRGNRDGRVLPAARVILQKRSLAHIDRRADVYAMGCVLYVATLGLRPFGGGATALGKIGAAQNRIEFAASNTKTAIQNISAAESVIRDLDMAEEMTKFTKNQILQQAGTAMLAQANQIPQGVLSLLR